MQPFPTDELVGEVSTQLDVPYWTRRTLYPRKFGYTYGQLNTPEAGSFVTENFQLGPGGLPMGGVDSFKASPVGASLLRSVKEGTGKTVLVKPVTQELQKTLNLPEGTGGVYFAGHKEYGHSNPTTRAVYVDPETGSNLFVLAHEAGHAVDPGLATQNKLIASQEPMRVKTFERSGAKKDPYTFLSSFMQEPLSTASEEAFAQRFAIDQLNKIGVDTIGALQDDWYKGYPASKVVEGLDNAKDYYVYERTGANPHRPVSEFSANAVVDDRGKIVDQFLNLALDKRYREQEELLRQRGRQDIDRVLGPYANVD